MTNKERIVSVLQDAGQPLCDTCLTAMARITTRQVTYMVANELRARSATEREPGTCGGCGKLVLCNRLVRQPGFILPRHPAPEKRQPIVVNSLATVPLLPPSTEDTDRPWYWEGNVQNIVVGWLGAQGWEISQAANTAAKTPGVDIIARRPPDKELWVTVKGFPEKSKYVQARHWFAGAIFDLVTYRDRSPELYLAVALPNGYATYTGLASKVTWLKKAMPFTIIWVGQDGSVRSE